MVPGVLVELLAPAVDRPVPAGVLGGRGHEAQGAMAVMVIVGVDERACPTAGALEIGKAFRRKGGMVLRGAEQDLCDSVVVSHTKNMSFQTGNEPI